VEEHGIKGCDTHAAICKRIPRRPQARWSPTLSLTKRLPIDPARTFGMKTITAGNLVAGKKRMSSMAATFAPGVAEDFKDSG
jgi:hypothetical protein